MIIFYEYDWVLLKGLTHSNPFESISNFQQRVPNLLSALLLIFNVSPKGVESGSVCPLIV